MVLSSFHLGGGACTIEMASGPSRDILTVPLGHTLALPEIPSIESAMLSIVIRRLVYSVVTIVSISIVAFILIQLPPGDYASRYMAQLRAMGEGVSMEEAQALRSRLGLDEPLHVQYWSWISGMFRGDFGESFTFSKPVAEVIGDKLFLTIAVSLSAILLTLVLAIPIGIYSSVYQNSIGDYVFTLIGFIGLSIPNFMIALVIMYFIYVEFGVLVGGLFSEEYLIAPWGWGKFVDMLKHLWLPAIIVGTAGTAALIRTTRANMLDELRKPYVLTARAKGLSKWRTILKYPFRIAMNPFVSTVGYLLPNLIGGGIIVAMVLGLPTLGPVLVNALLGQDMYLAGTIVLLLGILTVVGTFVSDLLLMWIDPRIRTGSR